MAPWRRPALVAIAWLLAAVLGLFAGRSLETRLRPAGGPPEGSDSARAQALLTRHFPQWAGTPHLLVWSAATTSLETFRPALEAIPGVQAVQPWPMAHLHGLLVLTDPALPPIRSVEALREASRAPEAPPGVLVTGPTEASVDLFELIGERLGPIERLSLVLSAVVLYVVFGSLLLAGSAIASGLLCLALLPLVVLGISTVAAVSTLNMAVAAVFALALGLDYPLFFLSRLREEYAGDLGAAIARTRATAGVTLVVSAAVMAAGGLALTLVPMGEIRSVGLTVVAAAGLAAGATLSLLPALLSLFASRWDLAAHLKPARRAEGDRHWEIVARNVTRRPLVALTGALLILGALMLPLKDLKTWSPYISQLPPGLEAKRGLDKLLQAGEGGAISPILVVWTGAIATEPFVWAEQKLRASLAANPEVARAEGVSSVPLYPESLVALMRNPLLRGSIPALSADGKAAILRITTRLSPDDPRASDLVGSLRQYLASHVPPGVEAHVGGMQAQLHDTQASLTRALPGVIAVTVLAIAIILGFYLRSVVLPVKALVVNALPVLAALGGLVLVFQRDAGVPGLQSTSIVVLGSVLFAISMDYELFMLARVRERFDVEPDPREAVVQGLARSARIVVGAALVLLSVFVPYTAVGIRGLSELGVGLSLAIALDATVVRLLLVPAVLVLMGRWNFWAPVRRRGPSHEETPSRPRGS